MELLNRRGSLGGAPTAVELEAEIKRLQEWGHKSSNEDGYCRHGTYVGGCGIDWMCGICENYSLDEEIEVHREQIKDLAESGRYDTIEGVTPLRPYPDMGPDSDAF